MSLAIPRAQFGNGLVVLALIALLPWFGSLYNGVWWSPPTPHRWQLAALAVAVYAALCLIVAWRSRTRVTAQRGEASGILIAWASQTGFARELAERSAAALQSAGVGACTLPLDAVDASELARVPRLLCIVSTTGEGDAPDHMQAAERGWLAGDSQDLAAVRYAVLALGDQRYAQFCAFGRRLDNRLQARGATPLFPRIEVDNADPRALQQWQRQLVELTPTLAAQPPWNVPTYSDWELRERVHVNPGSAGAPIYRLRLTPCNGELPTWKAGDIAEIAPQHPAATVDAWLQHHQYDGAQRIENRTLREWLSGSQLPVGLAMELDVEMAARGKSADKLEAKIIAKVDVVGLATSNANGAVYAHAHTHKHTHATEIVIANATAITDISSGIGSASPLDTATLVRNLVALPHRDYSLASIPDEGHVELLVRKHHNSDGSLGLGNGWLCVHAPIGAPIALRLRSNPGFHPPAPDQPMLLIGNGTGIAGLRAHLRARIAVGARRNWLVFGERNAAYDALYADELQHWQQTGWLERLDRVYSRDQDQPARYVQHALAAAAADVRLWVEQGACLYVCGSLRGMAPEVDNALDNILGASVRKQLLHDGRYRRDVY
ncbi:TPA: sulfite reductase flavoprotein subunit alpha [Xanthomonas vasicola pv. zeae]|uniref:NADPH--hemoprotein reductase n=3 Tax=Xanthomonas vasicola TaxID=56459 RepID=A0A836P4V4_XANVA|nr:flavodoxin domain-containing protein [Xanthomonas vasicola]AVQ07730.1 sulfite reductase [Xanthomonas vasicola pv. vasculorum]AZM71928.1 sulfite reductase [Xanthomonas vasicola pv. vasculorum]KFA28396.1 sulfite reductase [Xanthomonas vasicola pv. vasculorum NCPPB 1381]MBV6745515.1 sulfite reductase subunit alpha [Xanthomonas vasicola pv. vasculorum NCPPB 890]MBV6890918.1 sulfite reductase subunit alpha [Xanthomonas vasicola pv. vasculorum]